MSYARKVIVVNTTAGRKQPPLFGELKDELRKYNIGWVSMKSKVAKATMYHWLEGKTKSPHLRTALAVANAIGFEIHLVKSKKRKLKAV